MKWTKNIHNGRNYHVNFYHAKTASATFMIADHSKKQKIDVFCNCVPVPRLKCDTLKEAVAKVNYLAAHPELI